MMLFIKIDCCGCDAEGLAVEVDRNDRISKEDAPLGWYADGVFSFCPACYRQTKVCFKCGLLYVDLKDHEFWCPLP